MMLSCCELTAMHPCSFAFQEEEHLLFPSLKKVILVVDVALGFSCIGLAASLCFLRKEGISSLFKCSLGSSSSGQLSWTDRFTSLSTIHLFYPPSTSFPAQILFGFSAIHLSGYSTKFDSLNLSHLQPNLFVKAMF